MATIAKLDSNGVQVLPEGRNKTTSPQVHSSTDLTHTVEGSIIWERERERTNLNLIKNYLH